MGLRKRIRKDLEMLRNRKKYMKCDFQADCLGVVDKNLEFLKEEAFQASWNKAVDGGTLAWKGKIPDIRWRAHVCCWAATTAMKLEGDFVECGVFTGLLSTTVCNYVEFNNSPKKFYLFDTFAGIPIESLKQDEKNKAEKINRLLYENDSYEIAKKNFSQFVNAHLIKGFLPDSFSQVKLDKVCYLSVDLNNATAEAACIDYLWPRLVPSAIIVIDDYGWNGYEDQKKVWDDFAQSKELKVLNMPTGQGLLIKA